MKIPSPEYLRECFTYNPNTGLLSWKERPLNHFSSEKRWKSWNTRYSGKVTGWKCGAGYMTVNMKGSPLGVHRVAWSIYYGNSPETIDHINLDPSDNRITNLRECTKSENQHNRNKNKNNTSGFKNVCWHKQRRKWRAYIVKDWKQKSLGLFDSPELAYAAYCAAAPGFHNGFTNLG